MRVLNVGSINIDHVYAVDHFVRPGETLAGERYHTFAGGKGFNQSVALARAGVSTVHAGRVGPDASWLLRRLSEDGVDIRHVVVDASGTTGHAIIQVDPSGENAIVLYGGANAMLAEVDIAEAVQSCSPGDYLLLQNETCAVPEAMRLAQMRGLRIAFNPAPLSLAVHDYPLQLVDCFILNETEAEGLTGETDPVAVCECMNRRFPCAAVVLTLGRQGALYSDGRMLCREPAVPVEAVDTTAAGDTFIGYFLAEMLQSGDPAKGLRQGCRAAALCVTRAGAADSIPTMSAVSQSFP